MGRLQKLEFCSASCPDMPFTDALADELEGRCQALMRSKSLDDIVDDIANNVPESRGNVRFSSKHRAAPSNVRHEQL